MCLAQCLVGERCRTVYECGNESGLVIDQRVHVDPGKMALECRELQRAIVQIGDNRTQLGETAATFENGETHACKLDIAPRVLISISSAGVLHLVVTAD